MRSLQSKRNLSREESDVLNIFNSKNETPIPAAHTAAGKKRKKYKLNLNKPRLTVFAVIFVVLFILFINFLVNQPRIKLKGDEKLTIEAGSEFVDPGVRASYYAFGCAEDVVKNGTVDTLKPGTYTIDYSVTKGDKTKKVTRTVNVVDTTAPDLQLKGEAQVYASSWELYKEQGFTALDVCDGDLTSKVKTSDSKQGDKHIITYEITDDSGNTATLTRTVTIKDIVAPEILLVGKETVWLEVNGSYTEPGVSAVDDLDGVITKNIKVSGEVDTSKVGDYKLTYTIIDSSGNTAKKTRTVKVAEKSSIPKGEQTLNSSMIYLTFDDGPSSGVTPKILDILKKYNVKATFFICNYSDANKALVQRAVDEGHSIGIHGYTHDWTAYSSDEAYLDNIKKLHDKLLADTGYDTNITRFLGGSSNTVSRRYSEGIMTRLALKVQQAGYQYFDWNVSSADAEANTVDTSTIISYSTGGLQPNRNNIILMHDINTKTTTAEALPKIIEYGLSHGYSFAGLTHDTIPVHHSINN